MFRPAHKSSSSSTHPSSSSSSSFSSSSFSSSSFSSSTPAALEEEKQFFCKCTDANGNAAIAPKRQVKSNKKGNQGRWFYTCPTGGCNYFQWADMGNGPKRPPEQNQDAQRKRTKTVAAGAGVDGGAAAAGGASAATTSNQPLPTGSTDRFRLRISNQAMLAPQSMLGRDVIIRNPDEIPRDARFAAARTIVHALVRKAGWNCDVVYAATECQRTCQFGAFDFQFGETHDTKNIVIASVGRDEQTKTLRFGPTQEPDYVLLVDSLFDEAHLLPATEFRDRRLPMTDVEKHSLAKIVLSNTLV